jgi:ribosomal-protein-alanine N-acetyltransferase
VSPNLRPALAEDAPFLAALHAQSFGEPWTATDIRTLLTEQGGFGCLSFEAAPTGFILARAIGDEAEVLTVAVAPALRRAGLGAALVKAAAETARRAGAEALFLEVAVDNTAALALYDRTGFERVGFRPGYYRRAGSAPVDAFVLRRDLTA